MNEPSDKFIVAVLVVIIKDRKLLIMKRSPHKQAGANLWETLSGRLHHGEDPREGLLREVKEESGLEVELDLAPFEVYPSTYRGEPMLALVYKANYLSGEVQISDEHTEYRWATLSEFEEKTTLKQLLSAAKKLKSFID